MMALANRLRFMVWGNRYSSCLMISGLHHFTGILPYKAAPIFKICLALKI